MDINESKDQNNPDTSSKSDASSDDTYTFFEKPSSLEELQEKISGGENPQDDFGAVPDSISTSPVPTEKGHVDVQLLESYKKIIERRTAGCSTRREMFEIEVDALYECMGIATELYRNHPIPDNAYALSSLTNSYKSSLAQLEKMKDPQQILTDVQDLIKNNFTHVVRQLSNEIDKTRREFLQRYPDDKSTVEESFNRMLTAIRPETQKLFDQLDTQLRGILGIKK